MVTRAGPQTGRRRWQGLALVLWILVALVLSTASCSTPSNPFVAYSLREAQRLSREGKPMLGLADLGGITRLVAVVNDPKTDDLVLVGRIVRGQPSLRLDDLVAALRSRLLYQTAPRVSIDPLPDTYVTREQTISLSPGLEGTAFGASLIDADVFLKRHSLGLAAPQQGLLSFADLCMEESSRWMETQGLGIRSSGWLPETELHFSYGRPLREQGLYHAKFWFFPAEPYLFDLRQDVFCIKDLALEVQVEVLENSDGPSLLPSSSDGPATFPGDRFARMFTARLADVARSEEVIRRLKGLYDLVAVSDAVRLLGTTLDLDWFVHHYVVDTVATRKTCDLLSKCGFVDRSDGGRFLFRISGGIDLSNSVKWLNYGDVTPLKDVVLGSRPMPAALTWRPPLEGWRMPNAAYLGVAAESTATPESRPRRAAGFVLSAQSCLLDAQGDAESRRQARRFNGFPPPPPPPPPPASIGRFADAPGRDHPGNPVLGGVNVAPQPEAVPRNLRRAQDALMHSRPAADSLSWRVSPRKGDVP